MVASIRVEENSGPARKAILKGLRGFNRSKIGKQPANDLAITLRNEADYIVGGVCGEVWGDWLFVQLLWLDEAHRGERWATAAMDALEDEARRIGALHAYVDTFSFQAKPFYEKRGYRVFGELKDFPKGNSRFWLSKDL